MFFLGFEFLIFLPTVCILYFLIPVRFRLIFLLFSSYFFYSYWSLHYLIIILLSTLIDYVVGIKIESSSKIQGKRWLYVSIILNLGILCFFKYFNFISQELSKVISWIGYQSDAPQHEFLLPLGISFYTFQTLSYSIDVYKGKISAQRHFGKYALYVSFFPQLVAGPIERAKNLFDQFHFEYKFEYRRVVEGLQLILWGFFKKLIIADRLGIYVSEVFDNPGTHTGAAIWIASIFFLIQVFCDFSAYSNIAIGIARILGVKLTRNFGNTPYFTVYISSFFRTWHITLTNWMRDYVFIPLVKKYRSTRLRGFLILFIFLLMGIWHGANWTYIIWGFILGFYIAVEYHTDGMKEALLERFNKYQRYFMERILIFINLLLISLACLFFRSPDLYTAFQLIHDGFSFSTDFVIIGQREFYLCLFFWAFMEMVHFLMKEDMVHEFLNKTSTLGRWAFYFFIINFTLYFKIQEVPKLIYFEF